MSGLKVGARWKRQHRRKKKIRAERRQADEAYFKALTSTLTVAPEHMEAMRKQMEKWFAEHKDDADDGADPNPANDNGFIYE